MVFTGIIIVLTGIVLWGSAIFIVSWLHRRCYVPYALLTVGIITYTVSLVVQVVALRLIDRALLGILPVGALALGIAAGFSEELGRFLGFQYLAPGVVTRSQALMIGAGHGLTETAYTALVAISLGLSMLVSDTPQDQGSLDVLSRALAEALNSLLPVALHMALSWVVLQTFLRGELYWVFVAIFIHATVAIMATLLGPNDTWGVVLWHGLVAAGGLGIIGRLHAPHQRPT